ncbi:WhiB family transcriptional regulator [Mycobacterium sp. NPDC049093]
MSYWQSSAACANKPELFFVGNGKPVDEAKAICAQCPVTSECRRWAIDNGELHGVWAGMTVPEITEARRDPVTGQLRRRCECGEWAAGKSPHCEPCRKLHRAAVVARYDKKRREDQRVTA